MSCYSKSLTPESIDRLLKRLAHYTMDVKTVVNFLFHLHIELSVIFEEFVWCGFVEVQIPH